MSRILKLLMLALFTATVAVPVSLHAGEPARVDLNKASLEELVKLPRVGPSLAQKVIDYRKESGGFHKVEELMNVRGIGRKTFDMLKDKIAVGEPAKDASAAAPATAAAKR